MCSTKENFFGAIQKFSPKDNNSDSSLDSSIPETLYMIVLSHLNYRPIQSITDNSEHCNETPTTWNSNEDS